MGNVASVSCCLSSVVRVVHTNGKVYIFTYPVSVAELLLAYPHHYVCYISEGSNPKGKMLPLEMELQLGHTYLLVPLPRLFNKMKIGRRSDFSSCVPLGMCLHPGGQGFPPMSDSEDEEEVAVDRGRKGRVTLGSLLALDSPCTGLIKRSFQGQDASESPTTAQMQRILETAEMHWKVMCQGSRTWRPELESIKEEAKKSASSSPLHDLSLVQYHQPLNTTNTVNSSLKPAADSVQR